MPGVAVVLGAVGIALFLISPNGPRTRSNSSLLHPGESESEYLKKVDEELKKYE